MTKEMLIALDKKFDRETATGGAKVWASYFAVDGVLVMKDTDNVVGRKDIEVMMKPVFENGGSLRWQPQSAELSEDGTLGYTYGSYVRQFKNIEGKNLEVKGKYTSVWRKQEDGSWKIALDIGN
jgi:ketosteroid isomerase-like protein